MIQPAPNPAWFRIFAVALVWGIAGTGAPVQGQSLQETVEWLADPARGGRRSESPGAAAAAEYILDRFEALGFQAEFQEIGPGRRNVIARMGDDPAHLIVGAHYDGQGRGRPSASDNAAGVAALLDLARDFSEGELPVSLVLIAFDDEERGLHGSRYYTQHPVLPLADARAAIILDTMGRGFIDLAGSPLVVLGAEMSPELARAVEEHGDEETVLLGTDLVGPRSDFAPFAALRVPYLFFTNGTHADYHGSGDSAERIDYDGLAEDITVIRDVIEAVAALPAAPTYSRGPDYPAQEADHLISLMDRVERERDSLSEDYRAMFQDLRSGLEQAPSREELRLATTVLLSAATPRIAAFSLAYLVGPYFESNERTAAARAAYREAMRWEQDPGVLAYLQTKIASLETGH